MENKLNFKFGAKAKDKGKGKKSVLKATGSINKKIPETYREFKLNTSCSDTDYTNINLYDICCENLRNNSPTLDQQFIWYICFRSQVLLDSYHDFVEGGRCKMDSGEKNKYVAIIWGLLYDEIFELAKVLYARVVIDETTFKTKLEQLFPEYDNNSGSFGGIDFIIYHYLLGDRSIYNLEDWSLKLLAKCGIDKTTLLTQITRNNVTSPIINFKNTLLNTLKDNHRPTLLSKSPPYSFTCDTTNQPEKYQYTVPMIKLNSNTFEYIITVANSYDSGGINSAFSKLINNTTIIPRALKFNVYFAFIISRTKIYKHCFIRMDYDIFGDLTIRNFSLITNNERLNRNDSSVDKLCKKIKDNLNKFSIDDETPGNKDKEFKVILYSAYKFAGDFGKILYSYNRWKTDDILVVHASSDIISSNISGMFLPGTVHASYGEAKESNFMDFEFFYLRDTKNWVSDRKRLGVSAFGKSKNVSLKQIKALIKSIQKL